MKCEALLKQTVFPNLLHSFMRNDKGVSEQSSYHGKMMELNFSNY